MLVRTVNGINFVSGEKELFTCIQKWNTQRIHEYLFYNKNFVGFSTSQQRRTTVVSGDGV